MRTLSAILLVCLCAFVSARSALIERGRDDWDTLASVNLDDLNSARKEDIERVRQGLRKDLENIDKDLDNLLKKDVSMEEFKKVARHLNIAVDLAKLHEDIFNAGGEPIKPDDLSKEIPDKCKPDAFKDLDCKKILEGTVTCLKDAIKDVKGTLDSKLPVAKKVSRTKGVVGLVAKARDPIMDVAKMCLSKFENPETRVLRKLEELLLSRKRR